VRSQKKSAGGHVASTSAGGLEEMVLSAISRKTEATSRGWPPELDKKKSGSLTLKKTEGSGIL